jgi:hypothetical protein
MAIMIKPIPPLPTNTAPAKNTGVDNSRGEATPIKMPPVTIIARKTPVSTTVAMTAHFIVTKNEKIITVQIHIIHFTFFVFKRMGRIAIGSGLIYLAIGIASLVIATQ